MQDRKIAIIPFVIPKKNTIAESSFISPPPIVSYPANLSAKDTNDTRIKSIKAENIKEKTKYLSSSVFCLETAILIMRNIRVFTVTRITAVFGIIRRFMSDTVINKSSMIKITVSKIIVRSILCSVAL